LGLAMKFSYFYLIGDEGLKYFAIIKGIIQLDKTDNKIAKISNTPEEYIFNVENEKDIEKMLKDQGFNVGDGSGVPYYISVKNIDENKYIRITMRKFSKKYVILTYTTVVKGS
jgi:hypothetical protein